MSSTKPIKLYSHAGGPNPWKVAIMLNELDTPYETELMDFTKLHQEPFESTNPNGRVPAIEDPNTGITLFESGAILEYLEETYDKSNKFRYTSFPDKFLSQSWLHFQTSGQGPYFGQRAWFIFYHQEKGLTSVLDRYANEIRRVTGVLDAHLKKQGTQNLVGDKVTYADLAWVPWYWLIPAIMGEEGGMEDLQKKFPTFAAWFDRLSARPAVKKAREDRDKAMKAGH
ncbi:hypothetical protein B0A48_07812 [Cryoendolithus antarcticus]|uniref:Glutathione S-transferase n=1 Tax=Cryoendolithus antarcticus TaxID=1507870 RepID=A0A1V8T7T3_9PEZI|nr:hypothetical protein B0A48_07812 [Cryoendolithus antarcticus]